LRSHNVAFESGPHCRTRISHLKDVNAAPACEAQGWVEGRNVTIEYRWAEGRYDQLPALVADLIRRQVTVIAANSPAAVQAAKTATATIPIVFNTGYDPVAAGLVASLSRPGGNLTGVTSLTAEVGPKRVELLHEVVPTATSIALLVNPAAGAMHETISKDLQAAARKFGLQTHVLHASAVQDLDTAFATVGQLRAGGLVIGSDPLPHWPAATPCLLSISIASLPRPVA
jgi:putative ABC transport system substrate-binding protein